MKIAFLVPDNREEFKNYDGSEPVIGPAPEALLQGFAKIPSCEVHIVCCSKRPIASPEKIAPNIFYHCLVVPKWGWLATGFSRCVMEIRRKLQALQPDIVHGQGTERYCALGAALSGFPNVVTIHGNMRMLARVNKARPFSYPWLMAGLEAFTLPRTGGIVCITRYTEDLVKPLARRSWIVPNAVDSSFFEVKPRPADLPEILCVANIEPRKNQLAFMRSLDRLAGRIPFRVTFLGKLPPTPFSQEFEQMVRERAWCRHAGYAGRPALREALSQARLLVLPSLEDNCPMVVLEAMAAGVPVIASRVGGVPEIIEDRVTALFCDPLSADSMSKTVEELLTNPALADRLAKQGRESALKRFECSVIARRHLEIYEEVRRG